MPYINEDGTPDTLQMGYIIKCEHCGIVEKVADEATGELIGRGGEMFDLEQEIRRMFSGVRKHDIPDVLCLDCMKKVIPSLHKLRDVIELDIFVNRLGKAINEKRKQGTKDHRPTAHNACQCCERCPQWRLGHRACDSVAQAS